MSESNDLNLERLLTILRRRWWVIVVVTLVVGGATYLFSKAQPKEYTATASVLLFSNTQIDPQSGLPVSSSPGTIIEPSQQATAIQLLSSDPTVARSAARVVGHGLTAAGVSRAISVSQEGQTNIAQVSATSPSPSLAAAIANTYVSQYIANQQAQQRATIKRALKEVDCELRSLSTQQRSGTQGQALLDQAQTLKLDRRVANGGVQQVSVAQPPTAPSSPKVTRNTALGLVVGLLLGLGLVFLLERLDRRMKDVKDLEAAYRLPLLGAIPYNKAYADTSGSNGDHRGELEVFKLLRAYLRYFNVDRELRTLLVTSAAPGDGKTTVAHNLAQAAQETGSKTLLIEADLRRPGLAGYYGVSSVPGLSEALVGSIHVPEAIRTIPVATRVNGAKSQVRMDLLPAGYPPPNPTELIDSKAMNELLSWAAEHYELVVIDTPPIAVVSDAVHLLPKVDGVLLVSQLGKNTREGATFLRERLVGVNAPLLGVVANGVKVRGKEGYGYGYGYGYGNYEAEPPATRNVPDAGD